MPQQLSAAEEVRVSFLQHGFTDTNPLLGSPVLQLARRLTLQGHPNPDLYKYYLDPVELQRLKIEIRTGDYVLLQPPVIVYPVKEQRGPRGRRPNQNKKTATRIWLERRYPKGYQSLGSPLYQHVVNQYLRGKQGDRLKHNLSPAEQTRLVTLFPKQVGPAKIGITKAICYCEDDEISQWPLIYEHNGGWPRGLRRGRQVVAATDQASRRAHLARLRVRRKGKWQEDISEEVIL